MSSINRSKKVEDALAAVGVRNRELLKMVTIVVPTVSRPHCVHRQFRYWDKSGPTVIILDGAPRPIELSDYEKNSPNVRYIHTGTRFNERLASAGTLIQTPYAALLPDDEFFLKEGLAEITRFLERNPKSIGCAGKVLGFFVEQGRFLTFQMYKDWTEFPKGCDDVIGRLDCSLPPLKAHKVQFHVFRSEIWKQIFHDSYSDFYSCGYVYERLLNLCAAVIGRTELIDVAVWMRSLEHAPLSTENVPRTGGRDFVSWATSAKYADEVQHLRSKVRALLRRDRSLTEDQIEDYQRRFIDGGVLRQHAKERNRRRRILMRSRLLLIQFSPQRVKDFAKRSIPSRFLKVAGWQGDSVDQTVRRLAINGVSVNRDDLLEVASLVVATDREKLLTQPLSSQHL